MTKITLIREKKEPADKRVALTPHLAAEIMRLYNHVTVVAESSPDRCYSDEAFRKEGIEVTSDASEGDIMMGIKEVPVADLVAGKTYLFFSHTIKKQPHNRQLLREVLKKNIRLVDYECLTWENGSRILGFGRFAGIIGTYNGFLAWGKKSGAYDITPAWQLGSYDKLKKETVKIKPGAIKIALCGDGRVAHGAMELLKSMHIREVTAREFLKEQFDEPVFVQLRPEDFYRRKDGSIWDKSDFYAFPEEYESSFGPYTKVTDLMINAIYWHEKIPVFFTRQQMKTDDFHIKVIADITCDINGSIPSTVRATTIEDPVYGWHPFTEKEEAPYQPHTIDMMTVGNLPCELPADASTEFGTYLFRHVLPSLLTDDSQKIIERATIAEGGRLTPRFSYLQDFVD